MELSKENNFEELISKEKVLVDFYAEWCGPCKVLGPIMDEIDAENSDITVIKVNVDEHSELAGKYGIRGIPTVIGFSKGEVKSLLVGVKPKDEILAIFE